MDVNCVKRLRSLNYRSAFCKLIKSKTEQPKKVSSVNDQMVQTGVFLGILWGMKSIGNYGTSFKVKWMYDMGSST